MAIPVAQTLGPGFGLSSAWLVGGAKDRTCTPHIWFSSSLSQLLGQNGVILEEIGKKHLCLAEYSSVQKMPKPCSSSDQIM